MKKVPPQLLKYVFKKGNKAAAGKHRKSMKQYAKDYLLNLKEEDRIKFLNSLDPEVVWRMAEGNPPQTLQGDEDNPLKVVVVPESVAKAFNINAIDTKTE